MEAEVMWEKIKGLFRRQRGVWRGRSKDEKEFLINELLDRLESVEQNIELLVKQVGEIASYCDKCDGSKITYCMKCSNTGIVRKDRLKDWPWQ